nr:killer cell lectin-like receptor subfamily F member 1 [Anolis sagrei ordinatus]
MSYNDCSRKRAHMLVIQDKEEMTFIYSTVPEKYTVWIGLNSTPTSKSWTWIDGTALDQTLIQFLPSGGRADCGVMKQNRAYSELCTAEFRWICEKTAILVN